MEGDGGGDNGVDLAIPCPEYRPIWKEISALGISGEALRFKAKVWLGAGKSPWPDFWDGVFFIDAVWQRQKVSQVINEHFDDWDCFLKCLRVENQPYMLPSRSQHAHMCSIQDESARQSCFAFKCQSPQHTYREVTQFSTGALIGICVRALDVAQSKGVRERATSALTCLLSEYCAGFVFQQEAELNALETRANNDGECEGALAPIGRCHHFENIFGSLDETLGIGCAFIHKFVEVLRRASCCVGQCGKSAKLVQHMVGIATERIHVALLSLAPVCITQAALPRGKRRFDEDVKKYLVSGMIQVRKASTSAGAVTSYVGESGRYKARRWMNKEVAEMLAQTELDFDISSCPSATYGLAKDATRLGNPAKDRQCLFLWRDRDSRSTWLHNQELRDWKGADAKNGKLKPMGKSKISERMREVVKKNIVKKKGEKAKSLKQRRLANKEDAVALDHALKETPMQSLSFFVRKHPVKIFDPVDRFFVEKNDLPPEVAAQLGDKVKRSAVEYADSSTSLEVIWSEDRNQLHSVLDEGSASWGIQDPLYSSEFGCVAGTYDADPPHRRHRHFLNAISHAGLEHMMSEVHLALSIGCAPFGRSGFFGQISQAAEEFFSNFDMESDLFMSKYPWLSHCYHKGKKCPTYGSAEHKMMIFKWTSECELFFKRLPVTKEGRWFQITFRSLAHLPFWSRLSCGGDYLATVAGWDVSYDPLSDGEGEEDLAALLDDDNGDAQVATGGDQTIAATSEVAIHASASSSSSSSHCPASVVTVPTPAPAPAATPKSESIVVAKSKPDEKPEKPNVADTDCSFKGDRANMLDMSLAIIGNRKLWATWFFVSRCTEPVRIENGETLTMLSTRHGCMEWTWKMSTQAAQEYLLGVWAPFEDQDLLRELAINQTGPVTECSLSPADADLILETVFNYASHLTSMEIAYLIRYSHSAPGIFGGLLKSSTRPATLAFMKSFFEDLCTIVEASAFNPSLKEDLQNCIFPNWTWVLEVFIDSSELDFTGVSELIDEEVLGWSQCPKSTKIVENFFNYCRSVVTARSKAMEGVRVQHLTKLSNLDETMDRKISEPCNTAQLNAASEVDADVFKPHAHECFSLGEELLDRYVSDTSMSRSSDVFNTSGLRWESLRSEIANLDLVEEHWMNLLPPIGSVLWEGPIEIGDPLGIVIGVSGHAVILLPVELHASGSKRWIKLNFRGKFSHKRIHIHGLKDYCGLLAKISAKIPGVKASRHCIGLLALLPDKSSAEPLAKLSCRKGLKGVIVENLKKLATKSGALDAAPKQKRLEKDWVKLLIDFHLPELSEDERTVLVNLRSYKAPSPFCNVINRKNIEHLKKLNELEEEQLEKAEQALEKQILSKKFAANVSHFSKAGFAYEPKGLDFKEEVLALARTYLPIQADISLAIHKDESWMCKTPARVKVPKSNSAKFEKWEDSMPQLRQVLKHAWKVQFELQGEKCPHDLDELDIFC